MNKKTVKITGEYIKLQDLLKYSGLCQSGGQAKFVIQNGQVTVNDSVCLARGKKLKNRDVVGYDGREVEVLQTEISTAKR